VVVLTLAGCLLLSNSAIRLLDEEAPWPPFAIPLFLSAGLGLTGAIVPWLWPSVSLEYRRINAWLAWLIATLAAIAAMFPLDYDPLLGSQLLLTAAVMMEMSGRPGTLKYFWLVLLTLAAIVVIYYSAVPLRPLAD
jgi:hypothetical protein